ncbi:MAG TPA: TRAP transporter small permease [Candidatus Methylomirabilis sp.]|nr:TRAP transporter small permease [Candidatus Methylomirabilis sp.]
MSENLRWLGRNAEEVICAAMMIFMTVLGFANVVARYLGYSMAYTEELLVMLLVWLTMLGTAAGFKRNAHLSMTFFRDRLPNAGQKTLEMLSTGLTVGAVLVVMIVCAVYQIPDEILLHSRTLSLDLPTVYYSLAIPVGGALVIVRVLQASWREWKNLGGTA